MKVFIKHENSSAQVNKDEHTVTLEQLLSLENSSCTHINVNNLLDYVSFDKRPEVLSAITSKLRHKGTIVLHGVDMMSLSKEVTIGSIDTKEANRILNNIASTDDLNSVIKQVQGGGTNISVAKLDNCRYYVEAFRP